MVQPPLNPLLEKEGTFIVAKSNDINWNSHYIEFDYIATDYLISTYTGCPVLCASEAAAEKTSRTFSSV